MSTIRKELVKHLFNKGLFEGDATKIVAAWAESPTCDPGLRLDVSASSYPPMLLAVCKTALDQFTADYIAEHQPMAWYRPMFPKPSKGQEDILPVSG